MKKVALLAAAFAALAAFPAAANAGSWTGVVIAKDAKRHTLVAASANGAVRTIRVARQARAPLGRRVAVRAAALPDGTYASTGLRVLGRVRHIRFGAVVVKKMPGRLILSAGRSVFPLRIRGAVALGLAQDGGLEPGDQILCDADIGADGLEAGKRGVHDTGHVDQLDLEGIYLSTTDDVIDLAVVHRGLVHVKVPAGVDVPEFNAGDEISLLVSVEPDGSFTLIRADDEDASDSSDGGDGTDINAPAGEFSVTGVISELTATSIAVTVERHPEPVRCAVPPNVDLTGFSAGDLVEMHCYFAKGMFVLASLDSDSAQLPEDGQPEFTVQGFVASLDGGSIAVTAQGRSEPVRCAVPVGVDLEGFAVGDFVELHCHFDGGRFVLAELKSDNAAIPDGDKAWFTLGGVIVSLSPTLIELQVAHHPTPVHCAVPAGMDLRGFFVGEAAEIHCHNDGLGFYAASVSADNAVWPEGETPWFTVKGVLKAIGTDSVGIQATHYPDLVRCTMPVGTNLSGFALGDLVEMHCHFHDGRWNLAELGSEHAYMKLEN